MPIYVGGQSADVWAHQELFELTETSAPAMVSGVPPDAFSETGQLWGSPLYDWKVGQAHQGQLLMDCRLKASTTGQHPCMTGRWAGSCEGLQGRPWHAAHIRQ